MSMYRKYHVTISITSIIVGVIFFYLSILDIHSEPSLSPAFGDSTASIPQGKCSQDYKPRLIENNAFSVGEHFTFEIGYGPINAGWATLEVNDTTYVDGHPCYRITSTANSNKFFSAFYEVRDRVESNMDTNGLFSRRFEKHLREGSYRQDRLVRFDYRKKVAICSSKGKTEIPCNIQDILSSLYYLRTRDLKVGEAYHIDNYADGKVYPLQINVYRKETVDVAAGKFECFVVEPIMRTAGIFKHEGKLLVWLSADKYKIPVLMKSKVLVGSISARLKSFRLSVDESS